MKIRHSILRTSRLVGLAIGLWSASQSFAGPDVATDDAAKAVPTTKPTHTIVAPPPRQNFHLYVLMGQSNMVGRDVRTIDKQVDNPRILALDENGEWVVAHEPMHLHGTGIGPGIPFAAEMLKADPTITIGLVPCAVGNTSLRRWVKGGDLYEKALARANQAAQTGTLSGVLWQQGEADSNKQQTADTYGARLDKMLLDLRKDLGRPNLPIVVGQIGFFLPSRFIFATTVRAAIKDVPMKVPNTGFADSEGLKDRGDRVHFDAASQQEFGRRFADAMKRLKQ